MEQGRLELTAVILKLKSEYIAFIEQLPGVSSRGRTIPEARQALHKLATEIFAEQRRNTDEMHAGATVVRESMFIAAQR
jgi:predicted RNase H-like HicB family nuclease